MAVSCYFFKATNKSYIRYARDMRIEKHPLRESIILDIK